MFLYRSVIDNPFSFASCALYGLRLNELYIDRNTKDTLQVPSDLKP